MIRDAEQPPCKAISDSKESPAYYEAMTFADCPGKHIAWQGHWGNRDKAMNGRRESVNKGWADGESSGSGQALAPAQAGWSRREGGVALQQDWKQPADLKQKGSSKQKVNNK